MRRERCAHLAGLPFSKYFLAWSQSLSLVFRIAAIIFAILFGVISGAIFRVSIMQ